MNPLAPVINIFFCSFILISHIKRVIIPQQADPVKHNDGQHPKDLLLPADEGVLRYRLAAKEHDRNANNQADFRKADHGNRYVFSILGEADLRDRLAQWGKHISHLTIRRRHPIRSDNVKSR